MSKKHVFLFSVVLYFFLSYLKFAGPRRIRDAILFSVVYCIHVYKLVERESDGLRTVQPFFFILFSSSAALLRNINGEKRRN